jgi:hypothetical protein
MRIPRLSVPLTKDGQIITVEWHKTLEDIASKITVIDTGGGSGSGDLPPPTETVSLADFNILQAQVRDLDLDLEELKRRVKKLEAGYQA